MVLLCTQLTKVLLFIIGLILMFDSFLVTGYAVKNIDEDGKIKFSIEDDMIRLKRSPQRGGGLSFSGGYNGRRGSVGFNRQGGGFSGQGGGFNGQGGFNGLGGGYNGQGGGFSGQGGGFNGQGGGFDRQGGYGRQYGYGR